MPRRNTERSVPGRTRGVEPRRLPSPITGLGGPGGRPRRRDPRLLACVADGVARRSSLCTGSSTGTSPTTTTRGTSGKTCRPGIGSSATPRLQPSFPSYSPYTARRRFPTPAPMVQTSWRPVLGPDQPLVAVAQRKVWSSTAASQPLPEPVGERFLRSSDPRGRSPAATSRTGAGSRGGGGPAPGAPDAGARRAGISAAASGLHGAAEEADGGESVRVVGDEQGPRKAARDRRGVHLRRDDPPGGSPLARS